MIHRKLSLKRTKQKIINQIKQQGTMNEDFKRHYCSRTRILVLEKNSRVECIMKMFVVRAWTGFMIHKTTSIFILRVPSHLHATDNHFTGKKLTVKTIIDFSPVITAVILQDKFESRGNIQNSPGCQPQFPF